jgi:hypothetical protein
LIKEEVAVAAQAWADEIWRFLEIIRSEPPSYTSRRVQDITKAHIQQFQSALEQLLLETIDPKDWKIEDYMWGGKGRKIIMDYHPHPLLLKAGEMAGITDSQMSILLPWKAAMHIYPGRIDFRRGEGWRMEQIFPLPECPDSIKEHIANRVLEVNKNCTESFRVEEAIELWQQHYYLFQTLVTPFSAQLWAGWIVELKLSEWEREWRY